MVLLSIITVNRNNAAGLEKTLQSVWEGQSFSLFEHIVIDGGSADGSVEVIRRYADKLAYWVSEPDKGIYNAMNKGVRKAGGEYVLFLNSGDWLRADVLAEVFGGGKQYAEDIVYGDLFFYYSPADVREYVYPDSLSVSFLLNYSLGHPSTFIRRSLLEKTPYNENYRIVSDWAFWVEKILLDACTTRHVRMGITYFDTSGVSSVPGNQKLIEAEKADFLQKRFPVPIRNLYAEYEKLHRAMDVISKHRTEELAGSTWMQRKLRACAKLLFKWRKLLNRRMMEHKIKVVYDSQVFDVQTYGGISRYFCEIMQKLHVPHEVALKYSRNYYLNHYRLCATPFRFLPGFMSRKLWKKSPERNRRRCLAKLDGMEEFVFHPTYYDPYFLSHLGGRPYVVTVHDMIYERFPDLPDAAAVMEQKRQTICAASHVIAISEYTKKDVMELLHVPEEKISVVYHGTNMKPNARAGMKMDFPYLLYVGDRSANYKNWHRMLQAFARLRRENAGLHLVCTGRPFSEAEKTSIARQIPSPISCIHAVSASENMLADLYGQALAFVYPSLYEGFGIPILEAYACGCPVVLSRATCFPEIAREAGCYFDPMDVDDMVRAIRQVIYDPSERQRLIAAGTERLSYFSWEKAARETEAVYRLVAGR